MRINVAIPLLESVDELRDRVSLILAKLAHRLISVQEVAAISGTSTSTLTEVSHSLGATPDYIHIEPKAQAAWWVTDSDRAQWTATKVYLHFDTASVNFTGYVSVLEE